MAGYSTVFFGPQSRYGANSNCIQIVVKVLVTRDLALSILSEESANSTVEASFSRRRGFRKSIKRAALKQSIVDEQIEQATGEISPSSNY